MSSPDQRKRTRSAPSHCVMSLKITRSPSMRPAAHFDGPHRRLAQLHVGAHGLVAAVDELEQPHRRIRLAERRPPDVEHVLEPLELDGALDRQIRPRALRQRPVEGDVDLDRARHRRRIDARHLADDDAVARVDGGLLPELHVLGLRLGHAQLRLELVGLRHLGDHGTDGDRLPRLQRQILQHARDAGAHVQRLDLLVAELGDRAQPLELLPLRLHLRRDALGERAEPLLLERLAPRQRRRLVARGRHLEVGEEALLRQRLVGSRAPPRLLMLASRARRRPTPAPAADWSAIASRLISSACACASCRSASSAASSTSGLSRSTRIVSGCTLVPGQHAHAIDARRRHRRDPADLDGHQRALTLYLAQHRPALDLVDPHHRAIDRRRRRAQSSEAPGSSRSPRGGDQHENEATAAATRRRTADIHAIPRRWCRSGQIRFHEIVMLRSLIHRRTT